MNYLINNLIVLLLFLGGCATSSFSFKEIGATTVILATPDRILLSCEELDEDPDVGAYGFMIHILSKENEVITAALNIRPDKESCKQHIYKISQILKKGINIQIGTRGNLSGQAKAQKDSRFKHAFSSHGTFSDSGKSLELVFVSNEIKQCYDPVSKEGEKCPPYPFTK